MTLQFCRTTALYFTLLWHHVHSFLYFQHDSVFDMRRPHDLLTFLEQERRRETADTMYKKISRKEVSIDNQFMGLGMTDVENSNSECFLWDKVVNMDVHTSIVIDHKLRHGIEYVVIQI